MMLSDVTGGQIVAAVTALFTFLNLLFSGRAFTVARRIRLRLDSLAKGIGHPNPAKSGVSNGRTLIEKVESLTDVVRVLVERDLLIRIQSETPGTGRRKAYDDKGNNLRGSDTHEDVAGLGPEGAERAERVGTDTGYLRDWVASQYPHVD